MEVTRYKYKDKASSSSFTFLKNLKSKIICNYHGIKYGNNINIEKKVEFRLTDNSKISIGDYVVIESYSLILLTKPKPNLKIGNHVSIGRGSIISAKGNISIGNYTLIAPNCNIYDQDHNKDKNNIILNQQSIVDDINIGSDCWIGVGSTILKGVNIGDGSVIAAGSIVTKSIPSFEIWGGNPAKFIKKRI